MKKILMPLMLLLTIVGWYTTVQNLGKESRLLEQHMNQAAAYEQKGIYIDALEEYKSVLKYTKDPYPIHLKIMDMYEQLKRYSDFVDYGEMLFKEYGYGEDIVMRLVDYYRENNKKRYAIDVLNRAVNSQKENQMYIQQLAELRGTYTTTYLGKEQVYSYYLGYVVFEKNGRSGLLNEKGTEIINAVYECITPYGNTPELATVQLDGEWYCIDKKGYKKMVPDQQVEELGMYGDDLIAFKVNGLYGYMDSEMNVVQEPCWEYAGVFSNRVAPVRKDGKWTLIDTGFQPVTQQWFDEIAMSEYGLATEYEVFFGKRGDTYYLYNLTGEQLEPSGFDAVQLFVSEQPAAICRDGLWGFVSREGAVMILPEYQMAMSFSNELAPVLLGESWGYIDQTSAVRIPAEFGQAGTFSGSGVAPVYKKGWQIIKLIQ